MFNALSLRNFQKLLANTISQTITDNMATGVHVPLLIMKCIIQTGILDELFAQPPTVSSRINVICFCHS